MFHYAIVLFDVCMESFVDLDFSAKIVFLGVKHNFSFYFCSFDIRDSFFKSTYIL